MNRLFKHTSQLLILVLCFGGAGLFQHRMIYRFYLEPEKYRDALYVPSPGYLEAVAVGYDQFFANFLWLRMIQSFAAGWSRPENAEQMYSYFDGITDLDPMFMPVYTFAIMAVGEEGKRSDMVQDIVRKSIRNMPGDWQILRDGAFYAGWTMNDPDKARFYVQVASLSPLCPEFLRRWVSYFDLEQGRFQAAFEKYFADYVKSQAAGGDSIAVVRYGHLVRAVNQWYSHEIELAARQWLKEKNELPTVEQLIEAGRLRNLTLPDWGRVLGFLNTLDRALEQGQIEQAGLDTSDAGLQRLAASMIRQWPEFPAVAPYDSTVPARYHGYVIWPTPTEKDPFKVNHKIEVIRRYQQIVGQSEAMIADYKATHNGQCPQDVYELFPYLKEYKEVLGGEWLIDPATCRLVITSVPDILTLHLPE